MLAGKSLIGLLRTKESFLEGPSWQRNVAGDDMVVRVRACARLTSKSKIPLLLPTLSEQDKRGLHELFCSQVLSLSGRNRDGMAGEECVMEKATARPRVTFESP